MAVAGAGTRGGDRLRGVLPRPDEPLAVLLTRQLAEAQLVPHGVQARLVHAEDIAQGTVGDPLLALEQCHHRQEHGVELALGLGLLASVWLRGGGCSRPDEDRCPPHPPPVAAPSMSSSFRSSRASSSSVELALDKQACHGMQCPQMFPSLCKHLDLPCKASQVY